MKLKSLVSKTWSSAILSFNVSKIITFPGNETGYCGFSEFLSIDPERGIEGEQFSLLEHVHEIHHTNVQFSVC